MAYIFVTALDHAANSSPSPRGRALSSRVSTLLPEYRTPEKGTGYLAGEFPSGTTTVEGAPVSASVRVVYRPELGGIGDGAVVATTQSGQDGTWIVEGLDTSKLFDVIGRVDGLNDVIVAGVTPTSMVDIAYTGAVIENETFTGAVGFLELVGGIPPYAASVVDPLPAGIFPVVNGRQLIIDGTTTDDDVFNSTVRITSSNGATKDVPVKLVVGFKAPANFEAETLEDAGAFSVVLTWGVTNSTQEVLVFRSTTPFDLESLPAPIATLTGDAVSYTDDDVIEDDVFYYMAASVCESFTLYSDEVGEVVAVGDPHWDNVVSLLYFDDLNDPWKDETGRTWSTHGNTGSFGLTPEAGMGGKSALTFSAPAGVSKRCIQSPGVIPTGEIFTIEAFIKPTNINASLPIASQPVSASGGDQRFTVRFSTGVLRYYKGPHSTLGGNTIDAKGVDQVSDDSFSHAVLQFDGQNFKSYLNGVLQFSTPRSQGWLNTGNQFQIGSTTVPGYESYSGVTAGIIDSVRVTVGVARYTENFTPPTKPFLNK